VRPVKITVDEDRGPEDTHYVNDNVVAKEGLTNKNIYCLDKGMQVEVTVG
jgi:hypothetical protein